MTYHGTYFLGHIPIPLPPIPNSLWIETKQTSSRVPLSYDDYQIKGHMDNLAYLFRNQISDDFRPGFGLATLSGVPYSIGNRGYANKLHIGYFHLTAQFRIINGHYEFQFINHPNDPL